jgi:hypothetical protein
LLGIQIGIWSAAYLHFCCRDLIHEHITFITQVPTLERSKGTKFIIVASFVLVACTSFITAQILLLSRIFTPEQSWMKNINRCEEIFEADPDNPGELVPNLNAFQWIEFYKLAWMAAVFGLYIGFVFYRMNGLGRTPHNAFFNRYTRPHQQLTYAAVMVALVFAIIFIQHKVSQYIFITRVLVGGFIPFFILGFVSTYALPAFTSKAYGYPMHIEDKPIGDDEDERDFLVENNKLIDTGKDGQIGK